MIKAAGVLPYTKDKYGKIWFLLGREKPNINWGNDSGSWSEFGGSMNSGETPEEGASREFFEETMGTVFGNKCWMEHELKCGRYLFAMDSRTPSGKGYRSFVKYIPFIDYPQKFARYRTMSKKQPQLFATVAADCFHLDGTISPSCIEKTSMLWFSLDSMTRAITKHKQRIDQHATTSVVPNVKTMAYFEPDNIPHIRSGFAKDFEHLLGTTWAKSGFTNDEYHFASPVRWGGSPPLSISAEGVLLLNHSPPQSEQRVERPIIRTPQYNDKPVTPHVPTVQHSMRRHPPTLMVHDSNGEVVYKKRKRIRNNYKPIPPVF